MSLLPRVPASRTSLAPGVWFLALGAILGGLNLFVRGEPAGRAIGFLLAAILVVRGIARIRQARRAITEQREQTKVGKLGEPGAGDAAAS